MTSPLALRRDRVWQSAALAVSGLLLLTAACWGAAHVARVESPVFADADDSAITAKGSRIYWRQCRGCHGSHRQGQPFWRLVDADSGRRAPALDETGRAWRRSDAELFDMVKWGRYPDRREGRPSQMPGYDGALEDADMLAVLAFVKGTWPLSLRALQAQRNPGQRGMPAGGEAADWRLPPTCFSPEVTALAK